MSFLYNLSEEMRSNLKVIFDLNYIIDSYFFYIVNLDIHLPALKLVFINGDSSTSPRFLNYNFYHFKLFIIDFLVFKI